MRNVIVIHRYPGRYAIDLQRLLDRVEGDYLSRVNGFKKKWGQDFAKAERASRKLQHSPGAPSWS